MSKWSLGAVLLGLGTLLVGCESGGRLPETWPATTQHASDRFRLQTDIPVELMPRLVDACTSVYDELATTFARRPSAPIALRVFASKRDFARYHGLDVPPSAPAGSTEPTWIDSPSGRYEQRLGGAEEVATYYQEDLEGALRHELTHLFVRLHLRDPAPWLDEGIAEYARLSRDGRARARTLEHLKSLSPAALESGQVTRLSRANFYRAGKDAYAQAWLIVEHLVRSQRLVLTAPSAVEPTADDFKQARALLE